MDNSIGYCAVISDKARVVRSILKDYSRVKDFAEVIDCELGEYSYVAQYSMTNKSIIGKFCSIAHGTYVGLWEHNTNVSTHSFYLYETSGNFVKGYKNYDKDSILTTIENDVWIGANSVVLKGVTVHSGAIIGAGSVVTKDIPAYAIAAGNPAKVIKYRFEKDDIDFLLKLKWWNLPRPELQELVDEELFYSFDKFKRYFEGRQH